MSTVRPNPKHPFDTLNMCAKMEIEETHELKQNVNSRDQLLRTPAPCSKDGALMSSPYSDWPLGLQTPDDYPTVRISRDEAAVRVHERSRMDCSSMASQYVSGLSRRQGHLRPRGDDVDQGRLRVMEVSVVPVVVPTDV
jgi:hypothetical protein